MKPLYFFFCMFLVMSCSKSSDDNKTFAFTSLLNSYTGSTASVTQQQEIIHSETELQDIAKKCGIEESELKFETVGGKEVLRIKFQTGGTATTERNGVFIEDLLIVAYAKLAGYNRELPCRENSVALTKIEEAIMWLANRKAEREARGVYGTEEK